MRFRVIDFAAGICLAVGVFNPIVGYGVQTTDFDAGTTQLITQIDKMPSQVDASVRDDIRQQEADTKSLA